ncbi:Asp-tRNA(Asn)/Glu-tRNA(Gln) amidotransferase subunit GatA [Gudongella oleilytica]|uniref:Asp-tRNA(Asn)/Glu-tRNA(Gln) amidotransferase subunit GatA n=1 Tax=Gudongella oleilytica TaxID=1582259 RepID=UPI000EC5E619|nr:Asp-tRNA(Asn)/Glu-tRNA(Gln) amidotransferase subunit GatA [Gudongella oleilytica]HCO18350.1 Asp-tRNA(Asn)/Glu-tRNA(Gln) amidotransferase GatCAB subunit A [Tissierellales bacterium]HMM69132.1 Asp-tRNA(Asn)/Glu-tRNA(Gln) amidotransferase subunit GatA [Gudongella oleilytica]
MELTRLSAWEMKELLKKREVSSEELVKAHLDKIEAMDKDLNAFITVNSEAAVQTARNVDKKIKNGEETGLLAGIPIGIKDNIMTKDLRTTCGSKMLEDFVPPYDATVIRKIINEDGIVIGKTNMDEFAMGGSTETSYFGITRNPRNLEVVPGGSSGGSAAAVASGEAALALGSDTGGSVRQPASYCGVVGIKPTYGMVSRYGVVPMSNSLDQVGTFGRDVSDAYLLLKAIAGFDPLDATSSKRSGIGFSLEGEDFLKGLKVALPIEYRDLKFSNFEGIQRLYDDAVKVFENAGAKIDYVSLPYLKYALETYYIISTSEVSTNLSRFDGIRYGHRTDDYETLDELYTRSRTEGFGEEAKRRIMMGTYALSAGYQEEHYKKALKVRTLIKQDYEKTYEKYDVILSLASPILPFKLNSLVNSPVEMYMSDLFTVPINLAGLVSMCVPMGDVGGLPVGMQITGKRFGEETVIKAGLGYERAVK